MAPRTVEISPDDVLWDNMSIKWWEEWARTFVITGVVVGMVILWAIPVIWTASLSQLSTLAGTTSWLRWLDKIPQKVLQAVEGVLPALVLSILLAIVPPLLGYLAVLQGSQTGMEKQRSLQRFYFAFLFVQVFLVVSISSSSLSTLTQSSTYENITSIPQLLANEIPRAANYFFSYMILQAMSTSSGTLLQIFTLILWFVMPKLFDSTARDKWKRNSECIQISVLFLAPMIRIFRAIQVKCRSQSFTPSG
jgi:hypothetical protein